MHLQNFVVDKYGNNGSCNCCCLKLGILVQAKTISRGTLIFSYFRTCKSRDLHLFVSWKVFEAAIAWVNPDKDVRQELMARLMEHVRLPLLSREYLVQVSKKEY